MQNPLQSLPVFNSAVPQGTFSRAFFKGAGSGALMMGIFAGVLNVASMVGAAALFGLTAPALLPAIGMMGFGAVATGLFSGITASQRAVESAHSASNASHPARREPIARAPEHAVSHSMDQVVHNQRAWTERVAPSRSSGADRIGQIIADRSLSDRDRAAAILRDREQSSASEVSR